MRHAIAEGVAFGQARDRFPAAARLATLTAIAARIVRGKGPGESIRAWIPGCGGGAEVYSTAIVLLEALEASAGDCSVRVYGTDVDAAVIAAARRARYATGSIGALSADRVERFFVKTSGGYVVGPRVRDLVVFAVHDVARDPPFSSIDFVSCGPVLARLTDAQRKRALRSIHFALRAGGLLWDDSDTARESEPGYFGEEEDATDGCLLTKLPIERHVRSSRRMRVWPDASPREEATNRVPLARQLGDQHLLEHHAPPAIVVDDSQRIVHVRGDVSPYLTSSLSASGARVLEVVHAYLRPELGQALDRAIEGPSPTVRALVMAPTTAKDPTTRWIAVEVCRLPASAGAGQCFLVVFEHGARGDREAQAPREPMRRADDATDEQELAAAGTVLHRTIVELEATNEELDVANEELRVSNEELERLNGALQTSRSELLSVAEELVSVNGELRHRLEDAAAERQELTSLLRHVRDAAIFVSSSGAIGHFTETAARLLGLGPAEVGRRIDTLGGLDFGSAVNEALRDRTHVRREAIGADGHAYVVFVEPCAAEGGAAGGVLLRIDRQEALPRASSPSSESP